MDVYWFDEANRCASKVDEKKVHQAFRYADRYPRNDWYNQKKIGAHLARVDLANALQKLPKGKEFLETMKNVRMPNPDWLDNVLFKLGLDCEAYEVGGPRARAIILAKLAEMICNR